MTTIVCLRHPGPHDRLVAFGPWGTFWGSALSLRGGPVEGLTARTPDEHRRHRMGFAGSVELVDEAAYQAMLSTGEVVTYEVVEGPQEETRARRMARACEGYTGPAFRPDVLRGKPADGSTGFRGRDD